MFIITLCFANVKWKLLFTYLILDSLQERKDYALLLSFVGQARLQFAGLHSLFLALWCTVIEIGGAMMDLLFWDLMYLYPEFICCRRCSLSKFCILLALSITCRYIPQKLRIFNSIKSIIADTPHQNDISATLVQ